MPIPGKVPFMVVVTALTTALSPNRLPLLGIKRVKDLTQQGVGKRECDGLFWFLVGYTSHVIADGICHPYIMDKVGRYEGSNKADHRALELGIDVLLLEHFTASSGHSIEASYAGMDTFMKDFMNLRYANFVLDHFAGLIKDVYAFQVSPNMVGGWVRFPPFRSERFGALIRMPLTSGLERIKTRAVAKRMSKSQASL
jgi:hypothetical protein